MNSKRDHQRDFSRVQTKLKSLAARLHSISIYRLLSFVFSFSFLIFAYLYREVSQLLYLVPVILFVSFLYFVRIYQKLENFKARVQSFSSFLQREKWRSDKNQKELYRQDPVFPEGSFYKDLDIFGKNGLYTYLDTTVTDKGNQLFLKELLQLDKADYRNIVLRQEAIRELVKYKLASRKLLRLYNEISSDSGYTKMIFSKHSANVMGFWEKHRIQYLMYWPWLVFSWLTIFACIVFEKNSLISAILIFNIVYVYWNFREKAKIFKNTAKFYEKIESLDILLNYIIRIPWNAKLFKDWFDYSKSGFVESFERTKKVNARFKLYSIPVLRFFANLFFLSDIKTLIMLGKLEQQNRSDLLTALEAMEKIDSLLPFFNLYWHNKESEFPKIDKDKEEIQADWIGHPLISEAQSVRNPLDTLPLGKIVLITGSNMSGKTTYLRTIGVNCLLALCGAPTISKNLTLPPVKILTSIRNEDSLMDGYSFFYSEVRKIAEILKNVEDDRIPSLILIDEILKGTNTRERIIATEEILNILAKSKVFCFVTTHDLDLAKGERGKRYNLKHFVENVQDGKMGFDYKIRDGMVNSSNALKILTIEYPRLRFPNI
jgi:hypothetical protein